MTARISELPAALAYDWDEADELDADCLDDLVAIEITCDECDRCEVCEQLLCLTLTGAMVDDGHGGEMAMCGRCLRQPDVPRATGPGSCREGYDFFDGPI